MLKLFIAGALGGDAEVRHINNGRSAISFSVAHSEKFKDASGQQQERTTWVRCTLWRKSDQTTIAQYLKKGTKLIAEGTPSARSWVNNQGAAQASLELTVTNIEFMGSANKQTQPATNSQPIASQAAQAAKAEDAATANTPIFTGSSDDDDLPF